MVPQYQRDAFNTMSFDWAGFVRSKLPVIETDKLIEIIERVKGKSHKVAVSFYPNFTREEISAYYSHFHFSPSSYKRRF
jgi:hypothetical protein